MKDMKPEALKNGNLGSKGSFPHHLSSHGKDLIGKNLFSDAHWVA